jgi:hypothetical protein
MKAQLIAGDGRQGNIWSAPGRVLISARDGQGQGPVSGGSRQEQGRGGCMMAASQRVAALRPGRWSRSVAAPSTLRPLCGAGLCRCGRWGRCTRRSWVGGGRGAVRIQLVSRCVVLRLLVVPVAPRRLPCFCEKACSACLGSRPNCVSVAACPE